MFDQNDQNQPTTGPSAAPTADLSAPANAAITDPASAAATQPASTDPAMQAPATDPMPAEGTFNTTSLPSPDPAVSEPTSAPAPAPEQTFGQPAEPTNPIVEQPQVDSPVTEPTVDTNAPAQAATPVVDEGLLSLKQQALQSLSPLLSQLEQSPEEKFRTTMMMIQASDDQSLIQAAYDAANAIPDEKAKAQALLDVVNEINYFTQNKQNTPAA